MHRLLLHHPHLHLHKVQELDLELCFHQQNLEMDLREEYYQLHLFQLCHFHKEKLHLQNLLHYHHLGYQKHFLLYHLQQKLYS